MVKKTFGKARPTTTDELEERRSRSCTCRIDPLVTYGAFLDNGVSLARDVMEVVQQAERYAAKSSVS